MPTLADIYSAIDSAKRRGADFVQNPGTSLQQMLGNANDRARGFNQLNDQALAEMQQTGQLTGPAGQQLIQTMNQSYNPVGMMVPAAKDIAFKAAMLEKKGLTPKEIHKELGVHRGAADNQWRQELNDTLAHMKGSGTFEETVMNRMKALGKDKTAEPVTVGDIFHHSELYKHYPELKDIEVRFLPKDSKIHGRMAIPEEGKGWLEMRGDLSSQQAKDVMLHELQHPIQEIENWSVGGSAQDFHKQDAATKARDIINWRKEVEGQAQRMGLSPQNNADWYSNAESALVNHYHDSGAAAWLPHEDARFQASWPAYSKGSDSRTQAEQLIQMYGLDKKTTPYTANQMYNRLGGEVEARQVQARQNLTPQQRQQYFPGELKSETNPYGYDIPSENLLRLNRQGYMNNLDK